MAEETVNRRDLLVKGGAVTAVSVMATGASADQDKEGSKDAQKGQAPAKSKGPGKKVYRRKSEGPVKAAAAAATTIVLTNLTCNTTEDNAGADEAELRIWYDNNYQSHRKDMDNGDVWNLNIRLSFSYRVRIELWDLDNPGFPLYDDHDHLGTVIINPDQPNGSGTFTQDGADYRIDWIPG